MEISQTFLINVKYERDKKTLTEEVIADILINNMESLESDGEIDVFLAVSVREFDQGKALLKGGKGK